MAKRKKAASGEGGVYQRKDGRWDAYITVQTTSGPKVLRTTRRTKQDARQWLNEKRHQRDRRTLPAHDADRITVGEYLNRWLKTIEGTVARHTYRDYESKVRVHLKPAIGRIKLRSLRADDLQVLYSQKLAAGLSPRTVEYIHTTIRKALARAEAWDLVTKNVARHARPPRKTHSEHEVLSRDQVGLFFETVQGDRFEALYILALTTGMRRGEILGLKWADLDLQRGYLRVLRSLSTDHGAPLEVAPKREASKRPIKLLPEAVTALEAHRKRQLEDRLRAGPRWEDNSYVFPTSLGTGMSGNNLRNRSLRPLLDKAGLPRVTFHELRHTFATLELEIGTPAKVVQEILGHASIVQTMNTYSHVAPSMQDEAAERLRGHLFGGGES